VSFSVKPTNEEAVKILDDFNEIAKREAGPRGRSGVLVKAMAEYNQRHGSGNPQTHLTTFLDSLAVGPMKVLCNYLRGATSEGRVFCQKKGPMWIQGVNCYSCSNNQLRKKK
jgi:hypothetical protein